MGLLRVYRDIYKIDYSSTTGETYTLVDVTSITATVCLRNSLVPIESPVVVRESLGTYYVELNPILYTFTDIYEIKWAVQYVSDLSSLKTLITRFRMQPFNITGEPVVTILDNSPITVLVC